MTMSGDGEVGGSHKAAGFAVAGPKILGVSQSSSQKSILHRKTCRITNAGTIIIIIIIIITLLL